jgi:hypothetical protein
MSLDNEPDDERPRIHLGEILFCAFFLAVAATVIYVRGHS